MHPFSRIFIIKDKKTGVYQIYDYGGNLMVVDRPLNDSWDEDLSPAVQNARYCDIIDQVNKRFNLYRYAFDPNQPSPELCANEDRYTYQQRLAKHTKYVQKLNNIHELGEQLVTTSEIPYIDVNPEQNLSDLMKDGITDPMPENDDSTSENRSKLKALLATSSRLKLSLTQNVTKVDTERIEEETNNSTQMTVSSQSR